ncbi:hypothetical protein PR202_ga21576 [Eleusine coracana subsp. coracana]|uniref:Uncharacterized protein n=1 Tax=Eleusine coracana subsp. coracana TaxID=191504 RepID=A0AAV5CZF6_ELECO|nr:hypothetical protein PR202_ga21576 [Eleusine coracana subsp. coracana]
MRASTTKRKWTGHDTGCLMQTQNVGNRQLLPGKFGVSSLSGLSKIVAARLSKYVVSLASFSGDTQLSGCAGIFIGASCSNTLSILTSVSLVRSCDDDSKIKVRLSDNLIVIGWLHHYDLNYDLAVINIERLHGYCTPNISAGFQVHESSSKVVALGRCFNSGVLTISRVLEIGEPSSELCEAEICELSNELYEHMHSTYEVDKAWVGGPIVGFNGRLFGINCYCGGRAFLLRSRIVEFLENSGILRRNGYPLPKMMRYDISEMRVFNSFEEEFDGDIWNKLSEEVSSTLSECVVALASFKGIVVISSLIRNSGDKSNICDDLRAGIGGPLIDRYGNFVGMNFFHEEETPFIPRKIIQELLKQFNAKWRKADVSFKKGDPYRYSYRNTIPLEPSKLRTTSENVLLDRWPVPEPYWSLPLSSEL